MTAPDRPRKVADALRTWPGKAGPIPKVPSCTGADVAAAIGADVANEGDKQWCAKVAAELARGRVGPERVTAVSNAVDRLPPDNPRSPVARTDGPGKGEAPPDAPEPVGGGSGGPLSPEQMEIAERVTGEVFAEAVGRERQLVVYSDPDVTGPDAPTEVRTFSPDPMTVWDALAKAVRDVGLPDSVLPPRPVAAETRGDPLLPVVQSVSEPPEREAGRLAFGGLAATGEALDGQLPLLPSGETPMVPLLELADVRGGPVMARGRGAPLDLRLFVGACLWTPHRMRSARGRLAVKVRELRDFLYPTPGTFKMSRHWPVIRRALWRAGGYWLPGRYEWEGRTVSGWVPFRLAGGIGERVTLDDVVLIDVELPPGSAHGPKIDRGELARLGVESAPRFRAFIAAHSLAWRPGVTRFPHPRNRRVKVWTGDLDRYPILTSEDRRRLAYGDGGNRNRTRAEQATPWEGLPDVEIVTRSASTADGRRGWIVVPAEAARAIKRRGDSGGG